jgi:hypothetical protein
MRTIFVLALAVAAVSSAVAGPCTAASGVWNEKNYGGGDAGNLPASADITSGIGPLNTICGNIANSTNGVDMYEIDITSSSFSATASDRNGSSLVPALFLFDSSGDALYADEQGTLSGLTLTPGLYYLAITSDANDPKHSGSTIFSLTPTGLLTPTSGNPTVDGWNSGGLSGGEYSIALTSAAFAQAPEPAAIGLVGAGLLGVGILRRRRA